MGLGEEVTALIEAGVPEEEIGKYINSYREPERENFMAGMTTRPAFEMYGSAVGGVLGGIGGSSVPVLGTGAGAIAGGGLGAGAGGQIHDILFGNAGTGQEQALKAGKDIAVETGMGIAVPKVLSLGANAAKSLMSPIKSIVKMRGGLNRVGAEELADMTLLDSIGGAPDVSLFNNETAQGFGQSLRSRPGSSNVMKVADEQNYNAITGLREKVAAGFGVSETADRAGKALKAEALKKKSQLFDISDKLYSRVLDQLPPQFEVPNLKSFVDNRLLEMTATPAEARLNSEAIALFGDIQATIADGVVDTAKINSFKRMTKGAYSKPAAMRTPSDNALIELNGVYSQDIDGAVAKYGDPKALDRLKVANDFWKKAVGNKQMGVKGYLDRYNDILSKEEGADAYSYAVANIAKKKGGVDRLKSIFRANPGARGEIKAQVFHDLGKNGDEFSYQRFLTDYKKLAPEAKELLFGRAGQDFENLLKVTNMVASLGKRANFSNTENLRVYNKLFSPISTNMATGTMFGGIPGAVTGAAVGAGSVIGGTMFNKRAAQLYTDPDFVKWLADTSQRVIIKPEHLTAQVTRLALMSTRFPKEKAEQVIDYIGELGYNTRVTKGRDGKIQKVKVEVK